MSTLRVVSVNLLLGVLVSASLLCIVLREEYWPFSNYAMYSGLAQPSKTSYQVVGVTEGDPLNEVPLESPHVAGRFSGARYRTAIGMLVEQGDSGALDELLRQMAVEYETHRRAHTDLPALVAIRLYEDRWDVVRDEEPPLRRAGRELVREIAPDMVGGR
ncbi:MAG TPA: hypothetical protein PLF26_04240 [Blastocatellia bacterium]|nr:hypothetical protein [Blastocatellia bacterium]